MERKPLSRQHGETEWFPIGNGVRQGCILSPFNLYAEHIQKNWARLLRGRGMKIGRISIT